MAKTSDRKYLFTFVVLIFIGLVFAKVNADFFVRPTSSIEIVGNTFENGQLTIRIEASGLSDGSEIVYTIDGNIPTENDAVYEKAIQIFESDLTQAIVVRARTLKDNQLGEDIFTRTFILSSRTENINQRFKLPIFSISIDEDELYNPEKGIFVEGSNFDGTIQSANYFQRGDEWKREANLEIITENGEVLSNQEILLSVSGKFTSAYTTKSVKLFAKKNENIYFNFKQNPFGENGTSSLYEYDSLVLSQGGNDFLSRMNIVRWGLLSRFASVTNQVNLLNSQPVVVFLNGDLYGVLELRENDNADYFSKLNGLKNKEILSYQPAEQFAVSDSGLLPFLQSDLNDLTNRNILESKVDIEAFLKYYAFEYYINNNDWINNYNNFKMIKIGNEKFTPVLYDVDNIFSYWGDDFEIFTSFDYLDDNSMIFNLLKYDGYKQRFVNNILDLKNYVFTEEKVNSVFDIKFAEINEEIRYLAKEHSDEYIRFLAEKWDGNYFYLKDEIVFRNAKIHNLLQSYFQVSNPFSVKIMNPEFGSKINVNSISLYDDSNPLNGVYFENYPVELSYETGQGYSFKHWLVNGEIVNSEVLTLPGIVKVSDNYDVSLITDRTDTEDVQISSIYNSDIIDWIEISNTGTSPKNYKSLFLTDDVENLEKVEFKDMFFPKGRTIRVYGKVGSIASYRLSFNFKQNETIYLTDGDKIIDSISVPNSNPFQIKTFRSGTNDIEFIKHDFSN